MGVGLHDETSALETRDTREFAVCHVGTQQMKARKRGFLSSGIHQHLDVAIASL